MAPIRQPLTAEQPTEVGASPHQQQLREDGATKPQADMGAALQGALNQMSEMMAASQKQTLDLVKQMIHQEVPQRAHGPGPWEADTQARVLEAIHHQETYCPPPSETQAPRSGRRRRQEGPPRPAPWRDPLQPTGPPHMDPVGDLGDGQGTVAWRDGPHHGAPRRDVLPDSWQKGSWPQPSCVERLSQQFMGAPPGSPWGATQGNIGPMPHLLSHRGLDSSLPVGAHPGFPQGTAQAGTGPAYNPAMVTDHRPALPRAHQGASHDDDVPDRRHIDVPLPGRRRPLPAEGDSYSERGSNSLLGTSRASRVPSGGVKLPPFLGRESWQVWFNRFSDVADRHHWSDSDRLDELLPRIQGDAGEFVYAQLPQEVRRSYTRLTAELDARYRKVESTRSYGAQFSHRDQKPGEAAEEYAAELKRLYDKAYPHRATQTRKEDLLRRFLDGLQDEQTRLQVEFVKEPLDIDTAVYEVVTFQEARRRPRSSEWTERKSKTLTRAAHLANEQSETEMPQQLEEEEEADSECPSHTACVPMNSGRPDMGIRGVAPATSPKPGSSARAEHKDVPNSGKLLQKMGEVLAALAQAMPGQQLAQPNPDAAVSQNQGALLGPGRPWLPYPQKG